MACTLNELQKCEYDILCVFADFCEKNSLTYFLNWGTLLGAIRHNGFIPWDDDVDVIMDYKSFKKFIKLYKKNPVEGYSLSWIDCDDEYPLHFAKLRKDNTEMREYDLRGLKMHHGVWIDIFVYFDKPKTQLGVNLQELCLSWNLSLGEKYLNREKRLRGEFVPENSWIVKFADKCPWKLLIKIRKLLMKTADMLGEKNSKYIRFYDYEDDYCFKIERYFFESTESHVFEQREFNVPREYDKLLTKIYGDYMTPVETHIHVNLDIINL